MPKPSTIITAVAGLMNDAAQTRYTNAICLPYLNMALDILQETYALNGLPTTNKTTTDPPMVVPAGVNKIGFDTTPALPSDLIEIQELWESPHGLNEWTPVTKKEFIPHYIDDGTQISQFLVWAWQDDHIHVLKANQSNDLKMDYTGSIFKTPILIKDINVNLAFTNISSYLNFETAALCSMFIAENPSRAQALEGYAATALSRALGIPIKGMQSVVTRRRPFRFAFKHRGVNY